MKDMQKPGPGNGTFDYSFLVSEPRPGYKLNQLGGPYTIKDYYALPDEIRVELIDGIFYDMSSPSVLHQAICGHIFYQFLGFHLQNQSSCFPMISPIDVQLDRDDKTIVQPDVVIICDRNKIIGRSIYGAPEFILEVLSPSTRAKDLGIKFKKYKAAGVREYWIIDPNQKTLTQYDFRTEAAPAVYDFDATVPVLIWEGKCRVDLAAMEKSIAFLRD